MNHARQPIVDPREHQALDGAVEIFQGDKAHQLIGLGGIHTRFDDHAAEGDVHAVELFPFLVLGIFLQDLHRAGHLFQPLAIFVQRVAGDVNARHLFFVLQQQLWAHLRDLRARRFQPLVSKERELAGNHGLAAGRLAVQYGFIHRQLLRAIAGKIVHRAGFNQRFDHALVDGLDFHALGKIIKVLIGALLPTVQDRLHCAHAHIAHGGKAVADENLDMDLLTLGGSTAMPCLRQY